jgi:Na+-driven multidrug efflux pump
MIGRLGTQQLGAVSVASMVTGLCTFLFSFLLFLTTPEVAGAVGQKDMREVSQVSQCVLGGGEGYSRLAMVLALHILHCAAQHIDVSLQFQSEPFSS